MNNSSLFDNVVALCKRRGFVYPGSEIYGGLANAYEYGPLGAQLLRNIRNLWWHQFIESRTDMIGLDSSVILHPRVWEASGHVANFADAMVDCKNCQHRMRADHLIEEYFEDKGESVKVEGKTVEELDSIIKENKIPCPKCGESDWTAVRKFNQLFETSIGLIVGEGSQVYLRGETAQGIFVAFKNVVDSSRVKLPFGIGQIGKSFRNEITPGNFILRTLEFEQAEIEYFFDPESTEWEELFEQWKHDMWNFITKKLGVSESNLRWRPHTDEERSFYSKRTEDLEYKFEPLGFKELWGIAYRTDYDLAQHMKHSGADLQWVDSSTGRKFIPHVIEPAVGINRIFLMLLNDAYREEKLENETRVYLAFNKEVAPYQVAVFPLVANKPELVDKAREVFDSLLGTYRVSWDDRGNIGKRYRAQDEIGTPYCVTVDYQSLEDNTVTVRNRDTMQQERVPIDTLNDVIK